MKKQNPKFFRRAVSIILLSVFSAGIVSAQNISLEVNDKPISDVLKIITEETGFNFLYSGELPGLEKRVTLSEENVNLEVLLKKVFSETNISYTVRGKQIALNVKNHYVNPDQGQDRLVTGKVIDENGEPLPGVSIENKVTGKWEVTAVDGSFSIVAAPNTSLYFSMLGMESQTVPVGSRSNITVTMKVDALLLDNVVVTGFQTISKERMTGSFAKVSGKELESNSSMDLSSKLESSLNGVYVDPDGKIQVRGVSTLNTEDGKTDPLIVVDGFPIEGGLSSINPEDIESITLLRDAAATSIYGIKSANGVIVINRKSSPKTKFNISFNANYAFSNKPSMDYYQLMNSEDAVDYEWEELVNGGYDSIFNQHDGQYSELGKAYLLFRDGNTAESDAIKQRLSANGTIAQKQYEEELLRRTQVGQYSLSFSGGNSFAEYYVSGRIDNSIPMFKGNQTTNYYLDTRIKLNLTDNLSLSVATTNNFQNMDNNAPSQGILNMFKPYEPLIVNGELNAISSGSQSYNDRDYAREIGLLANAIDFNPINELKYLDNNTKGKYSRYQAGLVYTFDMGLKIDLKYQYEDGRSDTRNIYSPYTLTGASQINRYATYNGTSVTFNIGKDKSRFEQNMSEWQSHIARAVASYDGQIGENHYLSALLGSEIQTTTTDMNSTMYAQYDKLTGATIPGIVQQVSIVNWSGESIGISSGSFSSYTNTTKYNRAFSFFSNLGYSFKNKYNLTGSFRIDQSNIFGTDTKYRYKPMWSAGASWNMSKEPFMSDIDWVNNITLRTTYGVTGMIDKSTSPYVIIQKASWFMTSSDEASLLNAPNANLRWEETKYFNLGLDYSFFNNRLYGYIEYYNKYTDGVIAPTISDPTSGWSTVTANSAEISNKGVDINISGVIIDREFKWTSVLNISNNKNKIEKVYVNSGESAVNYMAGATNAIQYVEGYPVDALFSYQWAGLNNEGFAQIYDKDHNIIVAQGYTDMKYEDLVADGKTTPSWFGNFSNVFSWKNLSLTVNMIYKLGYNTRAYSYGSGYSSIMNDRWREPGDEKITNVPGIHPLEISDFSTTYATFGDQNTVSASHIRLKYLSLSYNLPKRWIEKANLANLSLSFQAENLGIIWRANRLGIDPDVHSLAGVRISIPALTTYSFGVKITL